MTGRDRNFSGRDGMGILQGCIFFTTSTKMPQGPKIFCLALIVDMLYFFSPQPHIFLGISSNLYTYVKLYTFSSHLLKLTKSVQWLTHVAEITLVDKKSKKNCLTAKFWQKMPQCSLANAWRIYTPGNSALHLSHFKCDFKCFLKDGVNTSLILTFCSEAWALSRLNGT